MILGPNITGGTYTEANLNGINAVAVHGIGCFAGVDMKSVLNLTFDGIRQQNSVVSFDASRSSSIYGNSTTVQPASLVLNYIIKY